MRAKAKGNDSGKDSLDFVGDHVAVNFLNTRRMLDGVPTDTLQSDEDVIGWMRKMDMRPPLVRKPLRPETLLRAARTLRALALRAVEQIKGGKHVQLEGLNIFLADAISYLQLGGRGRPLELQRVYLGRNARQYLAPVAEAIADLLANGDIDLVRHCEGKNCILWFYDRTKAHRRRWCTAEECGTRARVAAFRARRAAAAK